MTVFDDYAAFYDLIYADKDYLAEARYVDALVQRSCPGARTMVELGAGTGRHACHLAELGYSVTAIERSGKMLDRARVRLGGTAPDTRARVKLVQGDIRDRLMRSGWADAVVALFHVVSYQVGDDDLNAVFESVRDTLRPGGVFLFDVWYGPAVLRQNPEVRVKRAENDRFEILRVVQPTLVSANNTVAVEIEVLARENETMVAHSLRETHVVRYLFLPELLQMMGAAGMEIERVEEWLTGAPPDTSTWGVTLVARKDG